MTVFRDDGHLTSEALAVLAAGEELPELQRLEIAEHLSYCDACLERYAAAMASAPLASPSPRCRAGLFRRIRLRAARLLFSRFGAAAAAVAVTVTAVWTVPLPETGTGPREPSAISEAYHGWTAAVDQGLQRIMGLFDSVKLQGGVLP